MPAYLTLRCLDSSKRLPSEWYYSRFIIVCYLSGSSVPSHHLSQGHLASIASNLSTNEVDYRLQDSLVFLLPCLSQSIWDYCLLCYAHHQECQLRQGPAPIDLWSTYSVFTFHSWLHWILQTSFAVSVWTLLQSCLGNQRRVYRLICLLRLNFSLWVVIAIRKRSCRSAFGS